MAMGSHPASKHPYRPLRNDRRSYWQLTRKLDGKTVTRRLTPAQAKQYREWIANDRHLRRTIDQMRTIATKANEIRLTHPEV